ncbi:gamma-glutamyltransferase family protein [Pseudaestuariivita atlantica]|uniref:Gamma-glutamyltransferase n=1 Tax=Pseudaestuariivita atlantica TaxID=1317121 RepID=A0A0L1JP02_9RHOB|nr:gamma-glutamyltransferase family protein [Pseudaestuariivita atlantica]KNG93489.1 gamma-glutamyltransferase [Pseudaestuariivita atlantica]
MRDFHLPGRSTVYADNGMCAASHPLAASVAIDILKRGGNAMDAAIAGALVLGYCEPAMTGIGGDCFALWSPAGSGEVRALNGSGRAPAAASAAALREAGHATVPLEDPAAVTIPGAIDAFCHLAETEGKLGLDAILAPAIHYAEHGVPVAPRVAFDFAQDGPKLTKHGQSHLNAGVLYTLGERFRLPGQAEVLRRVARDGRDAFYTGEVADDMVSTLKRLGGVHTAEDFSANAPTPTDPVSGMYKGVELLEHPPNGQGATAILMLNMMAQMDLASLDPFGAERVHLEAEISKLAYDARNRILADADHTTRLQDMLSPDFAARLVALISPDKVIDRPAAVAEAVHKDTITLSVVDRDRMSVAMIYSIFHGFGSGIASDKFGILFQNRGAGFTLAEGHPNEMAGGKRPMHTIIPGMLRVNGQVTMPFGVMGGQYQPAGHARLVSNLVDHGMDLQAAIDAPRSFADPEALMLERGYGEDVRAGLTALGHKIDTPAVPIGGAQAIRIRADGVLEGGSDPRKDGIALGY